MTSVISPDIRSLERETSSSPGSSLRRRLQSSTTRLLMALSLLLALVGASWFAYQTSLVPQAQFFTPDWQGAQWVQAVDSNQSVSYFRYALTFNSQPDGAFVTVQASQVFRLYVNGYYIGSNASDFVQGQTTRAYMFDVNTAIQNGANVVGLRVANVDQKPPEVRATLGARWGDLTRYYSSASSWQATGNSGIVYPRQSTPSTWTTSAFDASSWQGAQLVAQVPADATLSVSPVVYEQGLPLHWLSAGGSSESYFVRQIAIPSGSKQTFLRVIATGETDIFINDHLYMIWNDQVAVPQINVANYLDPVENVVNYRKGLIMGVYDITPYLHSGTNTIALHVQSPGTSTAKVGLDTYKSAVSIDMLSGSGDNYTNLLAADEGWHASATPATNWTNANSVASGWVPPIPVGRPGENSTSYLPDSMTPLNQQIVPPTVLAELLSGCALVVLGFWLLLGLLVLGRYYDTRRQALEAASLAFLPALVVEGLLLILSRETLIPDPFPYTHAWELALVGLTLLSALGIWWHVRRASTLHLRWARHEMNSLVEMRGEQFWQEPEERQEKRSVQLEKQEKRTLWEKMRALLLAHWPIIPVILIAIPMIAYNLGYEPYWQDEISSYNAARGIMLHGYPIFTSGFVYPKAELFSYAMAAWMFIFGTGGAMPRMVSVLEYIVGIPVLYIAGCCMFNRRIAWLAAAMLAFSPYALEWGRQARMYEQANLMTMVALLVFYWALKNRHLTRAPYLAVLSLLLAYFSHEETFVVMPGLLLAILWFTREGRFAFPDVLRRKHWWYAGLIAVVVIGTQLAIVFITHPPHLGGDQSQRPQIQLSTDNISYYFNLLFGTKSVKDSISPGVLIAPWILISSLLAVIGCFWAFLGKNKAAMYIAIFQVTAILVLTFVFTMQADRYFYPQMSAYYLLAAYGFYKSVQLIWAYARPHLVTPPVVDGQKIRPGHVSLPVRTVLLSLIAILGITVLIAPMLPISNYNLFISRITGLSYRRHFADYDDVGTYMQSHLKKGDIVISLAPSISVQYYVGQVNDYFSIDRALFLFEKNGRILETSSGAHPLLNQADFQAILSQHVRIWFISDNGGYQAGVTKNGRFTFPPSDFHMVYEGYQSSIYFRSADGN